MTRASTTANQMIAVRKLFRPSSSRRSVIVELFGPAAASLQLADDLAARDAVGPRAEQLGLAQPVELAVDEYEDLLQHVLGERGVARRGADVAAERALHRLEQF